MVIYGYLEGVAAERFPEHSYRQSHMEPLKWYGAGAALGEPISIRTQTLVKYKIEFEPVGRDEPLEQLMVHVMASPYSRDTQNRLVYRTEISTIGLNRFRVAEEVYIQTFGGQT